MLLRARRPPKWQGFLQNSREMAQNLFWRTKCREHACLKDQTQIKTRTLLSPDQCPRGMENANSMFIVILLSRSLNRDIFKAFRSHRGLLGWNFLSRAWGFAQVFKGIPSERSIYESTLVELTNCSHSVSQQVVNFSGTYLTPNLPPGHIFPRLMGP